VSLFASRRFRHRDDGLEVLLPVDEQEILTALLEQFRELLMVDDDPGLKRLKPVARPDDPEANREFVEMIGDRLLQQRLEAIEIVERGVAGAVLNDDEVAAWLQTINGLRLVLGERLEVSEDLGPLDDGDPDAPARALYEWLGWLLEQLVDAATRDLPPGDRDA
jgi:hypothetical protein